MLTVEDVKQYLYIPSEIASDDAMISSFIGVSYAYLRGAINKFDEKYEDENNADFIKQCDLFVMLYTAQLYQNRNLYGNESGNSAPSYFTRALILQLMSY